MANKKKKDDVGDLVSGMVPKGNFLQKIAQKAGFTPKETVHPPETPKGDEEKSPKDDNANGRQGDNAHETTSPTTQETPKVDKGDTSTRGDREKTPMGDKATNGDNMDKHKKGGDVSKSKKSSGATSPSKKKATTPKGENSHGRQGDRVTGKSTTWPKMGFRFAPDLLDQLDWASFATGESKQQIINEALRKHLDSMDLGPDPRKKRR